MTFVLWHHYCEQYWIAVSKILPYKRISWNCFEVALPSLLPSFRQWACYNPCQLQFLWNNLEFLPWILSICCSLVCTEALEFRVLLPFLYRNQWFFKKRMKRVPVEIRKKHQAPGYLWWDVVLKTETNKNLSVS